MSLGPMFRQQGAFVSGKYLFKEEAIQELSCLPTLTKAHLPPTSKLSEVRL